MSFESHYTPYSKCISLPPLKSVLALVPYNLSPASCSIVSPTDIKLPLPIEFGKLSSKPQIVPVQSSKPLYNTNQSIPDLSKTTVAHYCRLKQQSSPPINM